MHMQVYYLKCTVSTISVLPEIYGQHKCISAQLYSVCNNPSQNNTNQGTGPHEAQTAAADVGNSIFHWPGALFGPCTYSPSAQSARVA